MTLTQKMYVMNSFFIDRVALANALHALAFD